MLVGSGLIFLNSFLFSLENVGFIVSDPHARMTLLLSLAVMMLALFLFRKAEVFPGVGIMSSVLSSTGIAVAVVILFIFTFRLNYARLTFYGGIFFTLAFLIFLGLLNRKPRGQAYYVILSRDTERLLELDGVRWVVIDDPAFEPEPGANIIADLREDLADVWERRIAELILAGHQIYHSKHVFESMTGKVQIEHLSENSIGALAPSESYLAVKRGFDLLVSLCLLPFFVPMFAVIALAIKLDSKGPAFYTQERVGYLGRTFRVIKFRTMRVAPSAADDALAAAKTRHADARITRIGAFLRRTRIDELPQVINVLKGEMSWIGPRPEAVPLSQWYAAELPFYPYRHVIRPGITGWAQINQGHVTELDDVLEKLHYDFFYIKRFSAWIDLTILIRTALTVLTGRGAR